VEDFCLLATHPADLAGAMSNDWPTMNARNRLLEGLNDGRAAGMMHRKLVGSDLKRTKAALLALPHHNAVSVHVEPM
jgi:hypothetical protein